MSVLSVPVLTMSLSRLQFLFAIATRLPFWPGPADLKGRVTMFGLDRSLPIPLKFSKCTRSERAVWPCEFTEHTREHALTLAHIMRASARAFLSNRCVQELVGKYLRRYFCRWCRFLLLSGSGRPAFSSNPRLPARPWPGRGWRWSRPRGSRRRQSCMCWKGEREISCEPGLWRV